ncbi:aldo/keto reductase [Sphingomonas spermidinifaciens]|uniref:Aldo/keto reductase n=1 Tax=Sphingomonas spermidinifaciens TaxID=1141889 RepID=A0A2A4B578_9SPHN|nr:aldo/keto reductase [Sphingomonas spermidinifaciens]PCD03217.1 aldo/keto reductase [Sphingomonas spermidinifaciens]
MTLPTRRIGPFEVSAIGLGCMNLSHAYGEKPAPADAEALLNRALDLGVTLLDTAALYGFGENERLVGRAVGHRRGEYTLASKCVLDVIDGKRGLDGSPAAIARTLDAALQRLGTDHIDLYYLHRLDKNVPIEESVGALVRAHEAGKIGAIGLSEMSAATIRRADAVHPVAAVQTEYSPVVRNAEIAVLDTCRELGIGFVAFSPVARGLLAGGIAGDDYVEGDIRRAMPRFTGEALAHNLRAVAAYDTLAVEIGCTSAQLSLAWVLSRAEHIVPIPGTRSVAHLEENVGALGVTITPEIAARIDAVFAPGAIRGPRYAAAMQAQIDTETFPDEELA